MRAKAKVLARFPTAEAVAIETWADGSPRHVAVIVDRYQPSEKILDIHDRSQGQGYKAAWASAAYWCNRHPLKIPAGQSAHAAYQRDYMAKRAASA